METGSSGTQILSDDECLALLGANEVGRVGIVSDGQPLVFPVNYVCEGRSIVVRTNVGTMLSGASLARWPSRSTASTPTAAADGASWSKGWATTSPTPWTPRRSTCRPSSCRPGHPDRSPACCASTPGRSAAGGSERKPGRTPPHSCQARATRR